MQLHKIYQSPLVDQLFLVSQVLPFVLFLRVLLLEQKKKNYYIRQSLFLVFKVSGMHFVRKNKELHAFESRDKDLNSARLLWQVLSI